MNRNDPKIPCVRCSEHTPYCYQWERVGPLCEDCHDHLHRVYPVVQPAEVAD